MNIDWAAGFFDGEGTVGLWQNNGGRNKGRGYKRLTAAVSQNDKRVLDVFTDVTGLGRVVGPYKSTLGTKSHYRWHVGGEDVIKLYELLKGKLVGKQKQFDSAVKAYRRYKAAKAY